jgi:DNA-binding CsgD family transcriptional regulator
MTIIMVVDREGMAEMLKHYLKVGGEEHLANDRSFEEPRITETTSRLLHMIPRMHEAGMNSVSPLTHRETEILMQVARGQSNKRIADSLYISKHTVKNHIHSIMRKLDAKDRAQSAVLAMLNGWLNINEVAEEDRPSATAQKGAVKNRGKLPLTKEALPPYMKYMLAP